MSTWRITRLVRSILETTISTRAGVHWSSRAPTCSAVRARCRAPRRATSVTRVAGWRPVGRNAGRHTARDLSTRRPGTLRSTASPTPMDPPTMPTATSTATSASGSAGSASSVRGVSPGWVTVIASRLPRRTCHSEGRSSLKACSRRRSASSAPVASVGGAARQELGDQQYDDDTDDEPESSVASGVVDREVPERGHRQDDGADGGAVLPEEDAEPSGVHPGAAAAAAYDVDARA